MERTESVRVYIDEYKRYIILVLDYKQAHKKLTAVT